MAELYPLGFPQDDSAEALLDRERAQTAVAADPFAPPPVIPRDPFIVPISAWRKVQADDIRRRAGQAAVLRDSVDLAHNVRVQAERERALEPLRFPERRVELDDSEVEESAALQRFRSLERATQGGADLRSIATSPALFELEAERRAEIALGEFRTLTGKQPGRFERETARQQARNEVSRDIGTLLGDYTTFPEAIGIVAKQIDRPFAAVRGFVTGTDPADSVRKAWLGLNDPGAVPWSAFRDIGFVRHLPDNDFLPFDLSARDLAAGGVGGGFELLGPIGMVKAMTRITTTTRTGIPLLRYVADLPTLDEFAAHVATSKNSVARALVGKSGINPSVLMETELGRVGVAYKQAEMAAEGLSEIAMSGIDSAARRVSGRAAFGRFGWLFRVDRDGNLTNVVVKKEPPIARLRPQAEAIEARLPPVPNGSTRLWRGNRVGEIGRNPSFTNDLAGIALPFREGYGGPLSYVDVPTEQLPRFLRTGAVAPGAEFMLPHELAVTAREVASRIMSESVPPPRSLAWNDVLSNPGRYDLTAQQRDFVDHVHNLVDEVDAMRVRAGLPSRAKDTSPEGWFYVPRSVQQLEDLIVHGRTNPALQRTYEEMAEGMRHGVRYSNDLRNTLESHVRNAYHEVNLHRLNEKVSQFGIPTQTVQPGGEFAVNAVERIRVQSWRDHWLPAEMAEELERNVPSVAGRDRASLPYRVFQNLGDAVRFHASVADFAAPFIQGQTVLWRNPVVWAKSTALHYEAFFDPTVMSRHIMENIDVYQRMAQHGVPVGGNEFFTALQKGSALNVFGLMQQLTKRMPDALHGDDFTLALDALKQQSYGRFQSTYDTFLASARSMMWQGYEGSWERQGKDLWDLARHVRNMTGGLDSRALGVSANQRGFESTWLAFAPRFTRSVAALVGELADPALRPEAARAIGSLLAGTTMAYIATGVGLGKTREEIETGLNPLEGKRYLSHEVNGDWIGVGGVARAMAQLVAQSIANPTALIDPRRLAENPLFAFVESRGAPGRMIAGAAIEALSGGTVDTAKYAELNTLPDLAKHLGKSTLPFTVQGILEGEGLVADAAAVGGLRTSPQTSGERRIQLLDEAAQAAGFGGSFERFAETEGQPSAEARLRQYLRGTNPAALAELDQLAADREARWRRDVEIRSDPIARASLAGVTAREKIAEAAAETPDDLEAIRRKASEALAEARAIRAEPDVQRALEALPGATTEAAKDLERYFKLFEIGNPDERDAEEAQMRRDLGTDRFSRVLRNVFAVSKDMPPQWERIQEGKRQLTEAGFYELRTPAWATLQSAVRRRIERATDAQRAILQPILDAGSFRQWYDLAVKTETDKLVGQGTERELAVKRAQNEVSTGAVGSAFDDVLFSKRIKWVKGHQELSREAIALGYLGAGDVNAALSGITPQRKPTPGGGGFLAPGNQPPERNEQPRTAVDEMAELFLSGSSYGQLAIRFGKTPGAVEQALRRHFGGSPLAAREST